jgi:hypothetical protein
VRMARSTPAQKPRGAASKTVKGAVTLVISSSSIDAATRHH